MPSGIVLLTAAQALTPEAAACQNLMRQFIENEKAFTIVFDLHRSTEAASWKYAEATGDYAKVQPELRRNRESEAEFVADGDRLTALMAARHCPLPDHVTSPATFRAEMNACTDAKRASSGIGDCGITDRALERAFPKPQSRRKKKR